MGIEIFFVRLRTIKWRQGRASALISITVSDEVIRSAAIFTATFTKITHPFSAGSSGPADPYGWVHALNRPIGALPQLKNPR